MTNTNLLHAMGHIDPKLITDAAPDAVQKKSVNKKWVKWASLAACFAAAAVIAFQFVRNPGSDTNPIRDESPISLDGISGNEEVFAVYDSGYSTVTELLDAASLIVRATPVAIEQESGIAVCWILRVDESNQDKAEYIRLRQIKDEYLLEEGQEAVLVLEEDAGEGYYHISGGGCGLFRMDEKNGSVSGMLLESLMAQIPGTSSLDDKAELSLCDIYDLLTELEK